MNEIKIDVQKVYESGDPYANDVLDLVDSVEASTEILNQVEQEVNEMDERLEAIEALNNRLNEMSMEELSKMNEMLSNSTLNQELMNAPITNEIREAIAQEQAENMAKAIIGADNAKHPIKFALSQMGASLNVVKNIPSQMRDNIAVARAAGLDCNTSLKNAASAVSAKTTDAFQSTKSNLSRNATKIATGATEIYHKSVDNVVRAWEKSKVKMENFTHKATKAFDIGMEAITLGGWSRFCTDAAIRANVAHKNGNYDYNKQIRKANEKGFEGGRTLFGVNIDDTKYVRGKEKAFNFLATAFTRIHGNMEGLETSKKLSDEGRTSRNQDFVDYWKDVKGTVWSKSSDVREEASGIKGNLGSTSPMDVLAGKTKELSLGATTLYKKADEKVQNGIVAAKEIPKKVAEGTKSFFSNLGGTIKDGVTKAKNAICDTAKNIAADAIETTGKGAAAFLKGVSNICKKAELFDRSQVRNVEEMKTTFNKNIENAKSKMNDLSADLERINGQKVQATIQIPNELATAKEQLMAASPTANIAKAIDKIEKEERDLTNKANRRATLHNAGVNLKNAGVIISDKVQISCLEQSIKDAGSRLNMLDKDSQYTKKEADMFEKWSDNVKNSSDTVRNKAQGLADKIRGNEDDGPDLD